METWRSSTNPEELPGVVNLTKHSFYYVELIGMCCVSAALPLANTCGSAALPLAKGVSAALAGILVMS